MTAAVWFVSVERPGARAEWDCATLGAPDPRNLLPTRRPSSGDFSRHIPRRAYSATAGTAVELESGLEHDLLRWLDLRTDIVWLLSQPVRFHFPSLHRRRAPVHTPDLLSQGADGAVTLWDARPAERMDGDFVMKAEMTADACRGVGWRHEIFQGLPTPTRMNLLWLNGFRRTAPWHVRWRRELEVVLAGQSRTVAEVRSRDDGSGELIATMWHLIATGTVLCDLDRPIRDESTLSLTSDHRNPHPHDAGYAKPEPMGPDGTDVLVRTRMARAAR